MYSDMLCLLSIKTVYSCPTLLSHFLSQITSEIWDIFEHILFQCLDIDKQTQQPFPSTWNTFKIEIYHTWTQSLASYDWNSSSYEILGAMFSIS